MKKTLAALALVLVAAFAYAQVTNVKVDWYEGNLRWLDVSGNVIATIDATNRKIEIPSGSTIDLPSGTVARAELVEDVLQAYGIPIARLMQTTGIGLAAGETAGNFDVTVGTNTILANGEVTDNETEVSVTYFQFVLPPEYVSAGDVKIRLPVALIKTGAPTNNGSTIDVEVFEQSDAGAVGSDICATAAQTFAALDTWYNKDFTVTATGLAAGDVLNVKVSASVIDSEAGAGTIVLNMAPPKVLLDVKG